MFVYHGIVDQTNPRGGLEFVFAILPTVVKIGASFIILRYRTTNKDESNPTEGAEDYFGAEIEAATIAEDEKTATFTSGNVTLQLPRDMKAMRVEIQYEAPIPAITSSMTCIMEHSLINVEPLHRELALFFGPVEIDGQFQGNLVALVLSKKGSSGASTPVRICMAWNSKTATGENVSNPAEPPDGSNDKDLSPHFIMCNEGHDFKATLSQRGDTLEISLRGRYMNDALSSWAVVAIPLLEKPRTTLQNILAGVIPDYTMTVTNTAEVSGTKREEHAVMCTITKETDTDLDEFLTRAGLFLAVVGLAAGLPAFPSTLGMGIAIAGLPLAIKPYIEMEYKTSTEASKLLYPGDSVQLACTGWTSRNDFKIDLVLQNVSSKSGRTQILTTRYTTRQFVTDKDKNKTAYTGPIIHNHAATETHISSIFFEAPLQLIQRRLLIVEGLTTVSAEQNTSFPLSLEEGAVIEYPDKQTLEATNASKWFSGTYHPSSYWSQRRDSEHPLFYSDPNRSVAVVQWETKLPDANPHDSIGQVRFFPGPPFTPVLALQDMWIFQTSGTNRTWVSADETWDDTLASIQKFESNPENKAFKFWGYIHDQNHYLWACPFPPDNSSWKVQQSPRCWVYFPIRHWVPTAVLAQK